MLDLGVAFFKSSPGRGGLAGAKFDRIILISDQRQATGAKRGNIIRIVILAGLAIVANASTVHAQKVPASARQLYFEGFDATATIEQVATRFPKAIRRSSCFRGEKINVTPIGKSSCQYLTMPYSLGGLRVGARFHFTTAGTLQTVTLGWPEMPISPTAAQRQATQGGLTAFFTKTYGEPVKPPKCHYDADSCLQWQRDGAQSWHADGQRIHVDFYLEPKILFGAAMITYAFDKQWKPLAR